MQRVSCYGSTSIDTIISDSDRGDGCSRRTEICLEIRIDSYGHKYQKIVDFSGPLYGNRQALSSLLERSM